MTADETRGRDARKHAENETRIGDRELRPESLMMSYGYRPEWSEGALKSPIFQTSTFVFETAEEGKAFFEVAYGLREPAPAENLGLIYSRLNNPDLEILENRLTLWDRAESAAVFESGMAAIATTLLTFVRPGDVVVHSEPLYGGTDHLLHRVLDEFGIVAVPFRAGAGPGALEEAVDAGGERGRVAMIYLETPANPTNALVDIEHCARVADGIAADAIEAAGSGGGNGEPPRPLVAVDNTFLGPVWQRPLGLGADLVLYSLTKYVGGHSDLIAGACLGPEEHVRRVRALRTFLGTMAGPWTGWLLLRSLETLRLRMTRQQENARRIADFLVGHPRVARVYYLGCLEDDDPQHALFERQCEGPGAMIAFDVKSSADGSDDEAGGEKEAFRFLDALGLIKLAVSLGSTESLAEHPATMTHADIAPADQRRMGITPVMVRLSVGVEDPGDLIADLERALDAIG